MIKWLLNLFKKKKVTKGLSPLGSYSVGADDGPTALILALTMCTGETVGLDMEDYRMVVTIDGDGKYSGVYVVPEDKIGDNLLEGSIEDFQEYKTEGSDGKDIRSD